MVVPVTLEVCCFHPSEIQEASGDPVSLVNEVSSLTQHSISWRHTSFIFSCAFKCEVRAWNVVKDHLVSQESGEEMGWPPAGMLWGGGGPA